MMIIIIILIIITITNNNNKLANYVSYIIRRLNAAFTRALQ